MHEPQIEGIKMNFKRQAEEIVRNNFPGAVMVSYYIDYKAALMHLKLVLRDEYIPNLALQAQHTVPISIGKGGSLWPCTRRPVKEAEWKRLMLIEDSSCADFLMCQKRSLESV